MASSSRPDDGSGPVVVRTTYLEISDPTRIVPARVVPVGAAVVRAEQPSPELNRFFYTAVGAEWHWRDRLLWSWSDWRRYLERPGVETWYLTERGTPAGYFELDGTRLPDVEVAFFGLLPSFSGRGLGGWLLESALRRGFALGRRVWLHTCTLDSPGALAHYQARGMTPYRVDEHETVLGTPAGPWPGAERPKGVER